MNSFLSMICFVLSWNPTLCALPILALCRNYYIICMNQPPRELFVHLFNIVSQSLHHLTFDKLSTLNFLRSKGDNSRVVKGDAMREDKEAS